MRFLTLPSLKWNGSPPDQRVMIGMDLSRRGTGVNPHGAGSPSGQVVRRSTISQHSTLTPQRRVAKTMEAPCDTDSGPRRSSKPRRLLLRAAWLAAPFGSADRPDVRAQNGKPPQARRFNASSSPRYALKGADRFWSGFWRTPRPGGQRSPSGLCGGLIVRGRRWD
jgi:hypothetical protein